MSADGTIDLERSKSSLLEMIGRPVPKPPAAEPEREEEASPGALEDLTPLPRAGDPYKAHARVGNKPVPTLYCLLANGQVRGFSLGNYDSIDLLSDDAGHGLVIVLRFAGIVAAEVRLAGQKLDTLYTYLGNHRVAWVRELPKGKFTPDPDAAVITGIVIRRLEDCPY